MKYVVISKVGDLECANIFPSRSAAQTHIVQCAEYADKALEAMTQTEEDNYSLKIDTGETVEMQVLELPDDAAYYEVSYVKNGQLMQVRNFTGRTAAEAYAKEILRGLGMWSRIVKPIDALFSGEWVIDRDLKNLHIEVTMRTVINQNGEERDYSSADMEFILASLESHKSDGIIKRGKVEGVMMTSSRHGQRIDYGWLMIAFGFLLLLFFGGLTLANRSAAWIGRQIFFKIAFILLDLVGLTLLVLGIQRIVKSASEMKGKKKK